MIFRWLRKRRDELRVIRLNETHHASLEQVVQKVAVKLGLPPDEVRRCVELSVITRGIRSLKEELER
ncbi:MAG TPA: hypothetical protein VKY73_07680 [Polyangiaceae bacterium]|nr:hypothetical protein [Polyangiaceae bacterium]